VGERSEDGMRVVWIGDLECNVNEIVFAEIMRLRVKNNEMREILSKINYCQCGAFDCECDCSYSREIREILGLEELGKG